MRLVVVSSSLLAVNCAGLLLIGPHPLIADQSLYNLLLLARIEGVYVFSTAIMADSLSRQPLFNYSIFKSSLVTPRMISGRVEKVYGL